MYDRAKSAAKRTEAMLTRSSDCLTSIITGLGSLAQEIGRMDRFSQSDQSGREHGPGLPGRQPRSRPT